MYFLKLMAKSKYPLINKPHPPIGKAGYCNYIGSLCPSFTKLNFPEN